MNVYTLTENVDGTCDLLVVDPMGRILHGGAHATRRAATLALARVRLASGPVVEPVYTPAPEGGQFCWHAVCEHNHPDTRDGAEATELCAEKLARIIEQGRLPKWAKLHNGT